MLRSLATLPLRLERSSANALRLAGFLAGRDEVEEVLYPGLPAHAGHAVAGRQMTVLRAGAGIYAAEQGGGGEVSAGV